MSNETLRAEAALCIWEAMLDTRDDNTPLDLRWEQWGTVEMRHCAIALAPVFLRVYDMIGQERLEALDLIPYDWEFVPAVLKHVEWHDPHDGTHFTADAATIARKLDPVTDSDVMAAIERGSQLSLLEGHA